MGNNYKLYFMTVVSATLNHRIALRWLSGAETTVDKESTKFQKL